MHKPIIQADESLVRNGNFTRSLDEWTRGPINPSWLGTPSEFYVDGMIRILTAGNQSSVSQEILIPKDTGPDARYVLSFLCETRHTEAGLMRITGGGLENPVEIALEPGEKRNREEDQARLAGGHPLELKPKSYEVEADLKFKSQEKITITIVSPKNDISDDYSKICITRIKLQVHLGKAEMQSLILDEESVSSTRTLHMCLGASDLVPHQLGFVLAPDNAWKGTKASLTIDDNPQGAIVAVPGWGVDHPLEKGWSLECPMIGDQDPYLFAMSLRNQYTAEPYPIAVSLGHHRLVFRDVLEAAYYPILEHGQKVRLGVQVASFYTGQVLSGRAVTWSVAGQQVKGTDVTDEHGWTYFEYRPIAEGDYDVVVSVESLYYGAGVITQTLAVRVLATDPWADVLAVVDGNSARWEEKSGYPNRGADYHLNVILPADLLGTDLTLHSSGDSLEQLGVVVHPALEKPVPATGVNLLWILTSEDHLDGRFYLSLFCSKLLLPSPKKRMSLARNLVKVGKVQEANKFPVLDENESVLLRVQVVHLMVSGDGDPVINALVEWETPEGKVQTRSGAGGWASVLYTPKRAGDLIVTASIKAHEEAAAVEQPFTVKVIATSPWKSEVRILLDEKEVDRNTLGVLCRRGLTHTLKVELVSGSSWVGKNISLHWRGDEPAIGLVPGDLGTPKPLLAVGVEWKFVSQVDTSISSLFELELRLEDISIVRELSGRLVAADLTEEVSLMLDQVAAALDAQKLYPCLGALHRFNVLPNALSPLVGLEASLTWSGTPADQLGATIVPLLDVPQFISDGGPFWDLDFTSSPQPGQFALTLALPQLDFVATAKPMALAHNKVRIAASHESAVDPVVGQHPAWSWVWVVSFFTGYAVYQVPVKWTTTEGSSELTTDAEGWSGCGFAPAVDGSHEVKALVFSPYDSYIEERSMRVTGLAKDPWSELMVKFDGGTALLWGAKTYFPRRKGEHTLELLAPRNSPLFGRELTLGMTGTGPAELGIRFLPEALGVSRKFHNVLGLQYTFKVDDLKDGSFALRLSSERLASLSPDNAMSLGEATQVLKISGNSRVNQTLDWGQEFFAQVTVKSVINSKPMAGQIVTWVSRDLGIVTSVTNYYGESSIRFVPGTPGEAELTATVGGDAYSESVEFSYVLNEPREIKLLCSPKPNGHVGELVSAVANVVSAATGEPLQGVDVRWDYPDRTIAPTRTDAEGNARVEFRMPGVREGLLQAIVTGGYAGWETKSVVFELMPTMTTTSSSSSSSSSTWLQEFRPYVDGEEVDWLEMKLNLLAGKNCTIKMDYKYSWLIGEPEGFLVLEYVPGFETQGLVFDPPLGQRCEMAKGTTSLSWAISTEHADSSPFVLQFALPDFEQLSKSPPFPGELINIAQELEIKFDEFDASFAGNAFPCHGAKHTLTVRAKPASKLLNKPIKLQWYEAPAGNLGVVVTPPLGKEELLTQEVKTWTVDCLSTTQNGDFSLQLMLVEAGTTTFPLSLSLAHNLVTAVHWSEPAESFPTYPRTLHGIRAISSFLNVPVDGVAVNQTVGSVTNQKSTGVNGEVRVNVDADVYVKMWIVNRYDESIV